MWVTLNAEPSGGYRRANAWKQSEQEVTISSTPAAFHARRFDSAICSNSSRWPAPFQRPPQHISRLPRMPMSTPAARRIRTDWRATSCSSAS